MQNADMGSPDIFMNETPRRGTVDARSLHAEFQSNNP